MKNSSLVLIAALAIAGAACAQTARPVAAATGRAMPAPSPPQFNGLPPLPPGCRNGTTPTPPAFDAGAATAALRTSLGLDAAAAKRVGAVLARQRAQREQEHQQRRQVEASMCAELRDAVGTQAWSHWQSLTPAPPAPPAPPSGQVPPPPPPAIAPAKAG